ncbi:GGDEF domain-containing protein [Microvirga pudoricolor]|uniref:GGDEF domain-containing protein n=1 Tax=Microvirga pudoricolor TaxID=2778729 RepID=UPI002D219DCE|nr:diguanylate cyclase [Microvirga pudoricolor]
MPAPPANEARRLEFLYACGILDTPQDERFDRVTRLASAFYEADVSYIGFVDDRYQWMKSVTGERIVPWIERDKSVCQIVIASGQPLVVGDMRTDPRLDGLELVTQIPFRFYAGVPLVTEDGEAVASLCILKREAQDADRFNLTPLSDLGSIAMDEVELWQRNLDLARLAETDGLTGVANRLAFDSALDRAIRRARRTLTPLSLLLMDLDHFKLLNDSLGHPAGDEVLRRFGAILAAAARRPDDVAARYGGEEFALILPDTNAAGAAEVARHVSGMLAAAGIPHPRGLEGLVTVSIGIATALPDALPEPSALVAQADAALYGAKRAGRNRFAIHGEAA